jgi:2-succinyl-6-hydroxy-2,4-cyclohexadiene-1-carboxylate synthase
MWMLLHGFTGSPRSWDSVIARATLDEDPLRPALFGHERGWRELEVSSFADEVRRLCAQMSSARRPRLLAGYSLGARVALGMLASAPELFDGALLIGVHPGLDDDGLRRERRKVDAARAEALRTNGLPAFISDWEQQPLFDTQAAVSFETASQQREIRLQHDPEGLARSLEILGLASMPSYADALASMPVPVTLMVGSEDTKFRHLATNLAGRGRHLESIVVEGAGHNLLLEAREAVAGALNRVERRAAGGAFA